MNSQYCKVGTVTPLSNGAQGVDILEYQYQNFLEKASSINDARLIEFFEFKAQKIKKVLENSI